MRNGIILCFYCLLFSLKLYAQSGCEVRGLDGNWSSGPGLSGSPPSVTTNQTNRSDFKIFCSSNNTWYPGGNNAWTNGGGSVTFTLNNGQAQAAENPINFSICAPGAFSGWDNTAPMTQNGDQWCFVIPNSGSYQWKPVKCGSWDSWATDGQRDVNSSEWTIVTSEPNQLVCINYNPGTGQVSAAFLPVLWLYFDIEKYKNGNIVHWKTATELNNDYFEVLYSQDGKQFETIGMISGAGTKNTESQYKFIHENPSGSLSFYKVRQVDFDGKSTYTEVRFIRNEGSSIEIIPNPSSGLFYIQGTTDNVFDIVIRDQTGKEVFSEFNNTLGSFDLTYIPSGFLLVTITESGLVSNFKIIKL